MGSEMCIRDRRAAIEETDDAEGEEGAEAVEGEAEAEGEGGEG